MTEKDLRPHYSHKLFANKSRIKPSRARPSNQRINIPGSPYPNERFKFYCILIRERITNHVIIGATTNTTSAKRQNKPIDLSALVQCLNFEKLSEKKSTKTMSSGFGSSLDGRGSDTSVLHKLQSTSLDNRMTKPSSTGASNHRRKPYLVGSNSPYTNSETEHQPCDHRNHYRHNSQNQKTLPIFELQ